LPTSAPERPPVMINCHNTFWVPSCYCDSGRCQWDVCFQ